MKKTLLILSFIALLSHLAVNARCQTSTPSRSLSKTKTLSPTPVQPTATKANMWRIISSTNALDGGKKIAISNNKVVFRCAPKVDGYVIPYLPDLGHMLEADGYKQQVRFRLDEEEIVEDVWPVGDTFDVLFIPLQTLLRLPNAHKLILEYKPDRFSPRTQVFELEGLKEALGKAGCNL